MTNSLSQTTETSTTTRPTVLVIFDPERGIAVESDTNIDTIVMDLGGPFDAERLSEDDRAVVEEQVEGWLLRASALPSDSVVRKGVEYVCNSVLVKVGSSLEEYLKLREPVLN
jgi:hypothetical protein